MSQIKCVIFDWAGTTVDFGSLDPVIAFQAAFEKAGIPVSSAAIRQDMGIEKHEHIAQLCQQPAIQTAWQTRYHRLPTIEDQQTLFNDFETALLKRLSEQTQLTPFVLETQANLRQQHIQIATTTGYTRPMLTLVAQQAAKLGYQPDLMCSKEDVAQGRPSPAMINHIRQTLQLPDSQAVIKVGDTVVDMLEGQNAGVITVGVLESSSLVGLSVDELAVLSPDQRTVLLDQAKQTLLANGADAVILNLSELAPLIASYQNTAVREVQ